MRVILIALLLFATSAHAEEVGREGRRFVISNNSMGVVMLDTTTGETWKFGWYPLETPNCKGKQPVPSECQLYGWAPLPFFNGTPGKPK